MRSTARLYALLLATPLLGLALLSAHTLGYDLVGGDSHERGAHGYLEHVPLYGALAGVLLVIGFAGRVRTAIAGRPAHSISVVPVALLLPACFLLQEHLERLVHGDPDWWLALQTPAVLAGLALQLPFALAAAWLVRTLDQAGERLGRFLGTGRLTRLIQAIRWRPPAATPLQHALPVDRRERGPPRLQSR